MIKFNIIENIILLIMVGLCVLMSYLNILSFTHAMLIIILYVIIKVDLKGDKLFNLEE